jgi:hypothetical protein
MLFLDKVTCILYFVRQAVSFNSSDDVNIGSRLTNVILGQGYMYIILVRQAVLVPVMMVTSELV